MAVEAINRAQEIALMVGGHVWPVADWLNESGDKCDKRDAAFAVVGPCYRENGKEFWVTLELSDFESMAAH